MKKFILLLTLIGFGFSNRIEAQCINYNWTNNSGCDWNIKFYDNAGNNIAISNATATASSGTPTVPSGGGCFGCNSLMAGGRIDCGCTISIPLLAGTTVTTVIADCALQGCSTISCSGTPVTSSIAAIRSTPGFPCANFYTITLN